MKRQDLVSKMVALIFCIASLTLSGCMKQEETNSEKNRDAETPFTQDTKDIDSTKKEH